MEKKLEEFTNSELEEMLSRTAYDIASFQNRISIIQKELFRRYNEELTTKMILNGSHNRVQDRIKEESDGK